MDFGVQVRVGDRAGVHGGAATPVVGSIAIGGRPKGLFGSKHRSHTTAWVVFVDVVRATILNQPLPEAVRRMSELIDETRDLPGGADTRLIALRNAHQVNRRVGGMLTGRAIYDAADAKGDAAQGAVAGAGGGELIAVLQDLVTAYLELRNATPLSVTHDTDTAGGHGEGTARGALVEDEAEEDEPGEDARAVDAEALEAAQAGRTRLDPLTARRHLWKLLDPAAVKHLVQTVPSGAPGYTTVPGSKVTESPANRLAAVIAQHLLTVRRAYPRLFNEALLAGEDSLRAELGASLDEQLNNGQTVLENITGRLRGVPAVPDVAPRAGVTVAEGPPRGTAQIVLGNDGGTKTIKELRLGSRPEGILGPPEGAHLTAFGLVAEGLKKTVEGRPLEQVGPRVVGLIVHARGLATAFRAADLGGLAAGRAREADQHANAVYARLLATAPDDPGYVGVLQDLIVAYLWVRNSLPLSAVLEGGVPAGKAEGHMLGKLREAERGYKGDGALPDDAEVLDALWSLLDSAALNYVVGTASFYAAPGIRGDTSNRELHCRVADILSTHVATARVAFPVCVARTQMRTRAVMARFLRGELPQVSLRPAAQVNQDLALTVDDPLATEIAHYVVHGVFPPPIDFAPADRTRSRRSTAGKNKRPMADDFEDESDFARQEQDMIDEEANIVRKKKKHVH